jgi:hypothetical protein
MDEIDRLRSDNACLRDILREIVSDLEAEVEDRYRGFKDHPAMARRYERDIEIVNRARLYLNSQAVAP